MAKMSDKTKRAINKGRRKAGLKPIKFGAKKKSRESLAPTRFKDKWSKKKYVIIRMYRDPAKRSRIIKRNLTLAQAKKHTNDPKTRKAGVWFDGFDEQV